MTIKRQEVLMTTLRVAYGGTGHARFRRSRSTKQNYDSAYCDIMGSHIPGAGGEQDFMCKGFSVDKQSLAHIELCNNVLIHQLNTKCRSRNAVVRDA